MSSEVKINGFSLYSIDIHKNAGAIERTAAVNKDITNYAKELVAEVTESERFQIFKFNSGTVEIAATLNSLAGLKDGSWGKACKAIADRLFIKELQAQKKYHHITNLRNGSLIIIFAEKGNNHFLIIAKVDHAGFLEETSLVHSVGLPDNNRVQKVAAFEALKDCTVGIDAISVSDSNSTISDYWVSEFLESKPENESFVNTAKSFGAIDALLDRKVKKISGADYWTLRNATLAFYRTNNSFTVDGYVKAVLQDYSPEDSSVVMKDLIYSVKKLPKSKNFDGQFVIDVDGVKARMKRTVPLITNLDLNIKGEIKNIRDVIKTGEDTGGGKFIKIYTESGYEEFSGESK